MIGDLIYTKRQHKIFPYRDGHLRPSEKEWIVNFNEQVLLLSNKTNELIGMVYDMSYVKILYKNMIGYIVINEYPEIE